MARQLKSKMSQQAVHVDSQKCNHSHLATSPAVLPHVCAVLWRQLQLPLYSPLYTLRSYRSPRRRAIRLVIYRGHGRAPTGWMLVANALKEVQCIHAVGDSTMHGRRVQVARANRGRVLRTCISGWLSEKGSGVNSFYQTTAGHHRKIISVLSSSCRRVAQHTTTG